MKTHSIALLLIAPSLAAAQTSYDALLQRALESHPKVVAARAIVQSARAGKSGLLAPFQPMLSLNGYAAGGDGSMIFASTVDPVNYAMLQHDGVAVGNLMLMWKIWTGGRDSTARGIGDAKIEAAEQMLESVRQGVALDLRTAYANYFYAQGALGTAQEEATSADETERVAKEMEDAGKAPKAFTLRASAAARKSEQGVAVAESALAKAQAALEEAAGGPIMDLGGLQENAFVPPKTLKEALEQGSDRPEIGFLAAMARSEGLQATAVRRSLLPEVSLMAMGGPMAGSARQTDTTAKFGVVFSVPVTDGGMRSAKIHQADAQKDAFLAQVDTVRLKVTREIESAWSEWVASAKITDSATAALDSAEESFKVERIRFESGK